jgi:hypothetical protein
MEHQTARDTTQECPNPLGARDVNMADHVGESVSQNDSRAARSAAAIDRHYIEPDQTHLIQTQPEFVKPNFNTNCDGPGAAVACHIRDLNGSPASGAQAGRNPGR